MKIFELVFSPTGGCGKVADIVAGNLGDEVVKIDLAAPGFQACDVEIADGICVIAVPVYGGRVPAAAIERISALKGNGSKAVLIAVYGNREFEDALVELQDAAAAAGFVPAAGISAVAEHSILRKFAAGRPDEADAQQLESFAREIAAALRGPLEALQLPGNRPYKERKPSAVKPLTTENCVGCGLCAGECPAGAISAENPAETDLDRCISCMRCIHICPSSGRKLPDAVVSNVDALLTKVASERKPNKLYL